MRREVKLFLAPLGREEIPHPLADTTATAAATDMADNNPKVPCTSGLTSYQVRVKDFEAERQLLASNLRIRRGDL